MTIKRLFISDVHIGAGRGEVSKEMYPYDWEWLNSLEKENFVAFLDHLRTERKQDYREIVFLGDLFDNWIFPHDMKPPTMIELINKPCNEGVVQALRKLSDLEETKILYVPGNHDMHATRSVMATSFPKFVYCPDQFIAGRMLAEHGHRYAMFNASPRFTSNIMGLPLGYFLSRIEATRKALTDSDLRNYHTYLDDALELCGSQTLSQSVIEALLEEAELDEDTVFWLNRRDGTDYKVTAARVKETYKELYNDWPVTIVSKPRAIFAELNRLGPVADHLCKHGKRKVCVMGHSHKAEIDKDTLFCDKRIYANTGYWCGSSCTFVEVNEDDGEKYSVRLGKWEGGEIKFALPEELD